MSPTIQAFANDATKALSTVLGSSVEIGAGGLSRASGEQVRNAGGPEWAAQTAELAAPLSIPAAGAAVRGGAKVATDAAQTLPVARTLTNMGRDVVRGIAPMTDAGAREVAGQRLRDITGGQERAAELADMIDPRDPYGRSPAQQTGDTRLLGLEETATEANPLVRERIADQRAASATAMEQDLTSMGGDIADTRAFFRQRLNDHKTTMQDAVEREVSAAIAASDGLSPSRPESAISESAVSRLRNSLDTDLLREHELWAAIPRDQEIDRDRQQA